MKGSREKSRGRTKPKPFLLFSFYPGNICVRGFRVYQIIFSYFTVHTCLLLSSTNKCQTMCQFFFFCLQLLNPLLLLTQPADCKEIVARGKTDVYDGRLQQVKLPSTPLLTVTQPQSQPKPLLLQERTPKAQQGRLFCSDHTFLPNLQLTLSFLNHCS